MTYIDPDCEGALEASTIALFKVLGWEAADCYHETFGQSSMLGRETSEQVVLEFRLREAIAKLNPEISAAAAETAVGEVTKDRAVLSPVRANEEVYRLLKDGVKVTYRAADEEERIDIVRLIDWEQPENNDFFLASQFWISGDYGRKRADLMGFVNGIPLVFMELKASHRALANAYNGNLSDYKTTIPQLFWYNAAIILSGPVRNRAISAGIGRSQ